MDNNDVEVASDTKRISRSSNFIRRLFRFLALSWIISYFSARFSTEAKSIALTDKAGKQLVLTSQNLENHNKLLEARHKYGRHLKRRRLPLKRTISDFIDTGSQEEVPAEANEVAADEAEEVVDETNDGNVSDDTYGFGSLVGSDRDDNDGDEESDYDWFGLGNDDADGDGSDYDLFGSDNEADTERRTSAGKKGQKETGGQKTSKKNKQTDGDDEDGWFDW